MNHLRQAGRTNHPAKNWDLKLAAIVFVGTCVMMSLVLPNWQSTLGEEQVKQPTPLISPAQVTSPAAAITPSVSLSPEQRDAALASYKSGQNQLQNRHYQAAATAFKRALEKSPELVGAYIGLGDAFIQLGDYKAAETNARHALSMLKLLNVDQTPKPQLKKELSYANQVLGVALLHLAENALHDHHATSSRMQALEAASHCNLATVFDQSDTLAHHCAQQAQKIATHS